MHNFLKPAVLTGLLAGHALAVDVPANVQSLYDSIKAKGSCTNQLATGFYSQENDSKDFSYCGDRLASDGIIYLQGRNGALVNMDVDCDGAQGQGGDGSCDSSTDTQSQTAFMDEIKSYKKGINDVNAYIHPYVVLGNDGKKGGYINFNPENYGIKPLSIVAVKCGSKLIYGIWADTNGDDGPPMVGEASLSLAQACYGGAVNGNSAHDPNDVLYIAFAGDDAVPGANGANWNAKSYQEFEDSIQAQGDRLIQKIGGGSGGNAPTTTAAAPPATKTTSAVQTSSAVQTTLVSSTKPATTRLPPASSPLPPASSPLPPVYTAPASSAPAPSVPTTSIPVPAKPVVTATSEGSSCPAPTAAACSWKGHCAGAKCHSSDDCADDLSCKKGVCTK